MPSAYRAWRFNDPMLNMSKIVGIVTTIIGGALGLLLIANLLPVFFPALASVNDYLKNPATTTGDGTADSMLTIYHGRQV